MALASSTFALAASAAAAAGPKSSGGSALPVTSGKAAVRELATQHGVNPTLMSKVSPAVQQARAANLAHGRRGEVRCGRVWRGQRAEQIPYREDSLPVFASKGKGQIGNALSPFNVEVPCDMTRGWATKDGSPGAPQLPGPQKLELVWQSAKVQQGESLPDFFQRRERIFQGKTPKRRYVERGAGIAGACFGSAADPLVQYVPSRVFYCTAYERAISALPEFMYLRGLVEQGFNLLILGPDGHPLETEDGTIDKAYIDPGLQFGHERVLVAMLRGERPWATAPRCWRE